ncbi:hypothetical protein M0802_007328 [Mischocyttarus mexicanus]|nr:hypothetical protein M0802_007328 [Mischocyttarus mexicanus]
MSVYTFTQACESVAQSLRNYLAEDILFWFQNQLFGEACRVMLGVKFQSVNHFIETLKIGDDVYLLAVKQGKSGNTYNGPYKILELTDNNNAIIDLGNGKTCKVHVDRLKLYKI